MRDLTDDELLTIHKMHSSGAGWFQIANKIGGIRPQEVKHLCEELIEDEPVGKDGEPVKEDEIEIEAPKHEVSKYHNRKNKTRTDRTSLGLRDVLFDTMERLLDGEIQAYEAQAVAKVAGSICQTVKLEMDAERMRHDGLLSGPNGPQSLKLGSVRE